MSARLCTCGKKLVTINGETVIGHVPARYYLDTGDTAGQCPVCNKPFRFSSGKDCLAVTLRRLTKT